MSGLLKFSSVAVVNLAILFCLLTIPGLAQTSSVPIGIFEGHTDIGEVVHPGIAEYDADKKTYTITAAGENMWSTRDAFYFLWQKAAGDIELSADIRFPQEGRRPHRKAVLILKHDLAADGVYADAALHGSGMTALQYRRTQGATTQDIELNLDLPQRARLLKQGNEITLFLSMHGEPLHQAGASIELHFEGPFYVGIGVCSHDKDATETAVFSRVELKTPAPLMSGKLVLFSALQTIQTEDNYRRSMMVRTEPGRIGSANWSADGQTLYFNRDGHMEKMAVLGGTAETFSVGSGLWCDDNHGLSPDNRFFAASCATAKGQPSSIYVLALTGGVARRITRDGAAEFHGWSPDGATVAFTRSKDGRSDVYTVPAQGGKPVRLTTSGYNDGPEFGPDGNIYFNSDRSGSMQIWCMGSNGARPEQISSDDAEDWFPHVSPDGKQMVYLSYARGTKGHPANQDVKLRLEELSGRQSRVLVDLLGGQGTLNAPSWSPDNHHLAFTGFELLPADAEGPEFVMVAPKPDVPAK